MNVLKPIRSSLYVSLFPEFSWGRGLTHKIPCPHPYRNKDSRVPLKISYRPSMKPMFPTGASRNGPDGTLDVR